jgi:protein TonB
MAGLRIVDAVFSRGDKPAPWHGPIAIAAAFAVHGAMLWWALGRPPAPPDDDPPAAEQTIELSAPPPPPPPPPPAPPPPQETPPPKQKARVRQAAPPPPAQAGKIIAQEPDPNRPVDLTDRGLVTGSAQTYAGGYTSATGTNTHAVDTPVVDPQAKPAATSDRSHAVALTDDDWTCPWPREAENQYQDEQIVVLRVEVRADGSVETARATSDPGFGFGKAAVACALRTRFEPAADRDGRPIRSTSPPIRVRFTR